MSNLEFLIHRQSTPSLTEPAPSQAELDNILASGMRAPDHGCLKPWHFQVITGLGLQRLSDLFVEAVTQEISENQAFIDGGIITDAQLEQKIAKTRKMPFRAPMIIVISTKYTEHEKVPFPEQLITAGCAVHAMQMSASIQGYGAMWRTGNLAYNGIVKQGLGIESKNDIVGFLYIGSPSKIVPTKPVTPFKHHVSYWT